MTDNNQNIDRMNNPKTAGERDQVRNIQKFHTDTNVILDVRDKLKNLKAELAEDKTNLDNQISYLEHQKEARFPKERIYDDLHINKKIKSIFSQLLSFRRTKNNFTKKYGHNRKVTWRLFNFLLDKSIFFPARSVYFFAKHITSVQQELRVYYRKMFRSGWLNMKGEQILTPLEFNLIGEMERLTHDNSIINFMIYYKQPAQAIKKVSSFLGYYFSVTRNRQTIDLVVSASRKSLNEIVFDDSDEINKVPLLIKKISSFLSQEVDYEFIIPFFESAFLEKLDSTSLRELVILKELDSKNYKADNNLLLMMANRKSNYAEELKNQVIQIESEIEQIQAITEIINTKVKNRTIETLFKNTQDIPFLDYVLLIHNNYEADDFTTKRYNIAAYISDLLDFFDKTYESIFSEGINVKSGQGITVTRLFEPQIFSDETSIIKKEGRTVSEFISSGYRFDVLENTVSDKKCELFVTSLNNLVDAFYGIAEKLMTIIRGHENLSHENKNTTNRPVMLKNYSNSLIPFYDEKILKLHSTITNPLSLKNKKVKEALKDIITFSYCLVSRFEHRKRDFSKSWRTESLYDKLNKISSLLSKLEELQNNKTF